MADVFIRSGSGPTALHGVITLSRKFGPGDPPPYGYLGWHDWADVQHKAGLRQVTCGRCGRWKYPQELGEKVDISHPFASDGQQLEVRSPVCKECDR